MDAACREIGGIFFAQVTPVMGIPISVLFPRIFAPNGFLPFGWVTARARAKNTPKTLKTGYFQILKVLFEVLFL